MTKAALAALLAMGGAAFFLSRRATAAPAPSSTTGAIQARTEELVEDIMNALTPGPWQPPARAAPYLSAIAAAEAREGIPQNMLARLIYQESRYREDIIRGEVVSSAGAQGIAQIVPRWHPDVNPLDPFASIDYAAKYLAQLYRQFGSWQLALAGYNWGPGNVRSKGFEAAPKETRDYVAQITGDIGYA